MTILLKHAQTMRLQSVFSQSQGAWSLLRLCGATNPTLPRSYTTKLFSSIISRSSLSRQPTGKTLQSISQQRRLATTDTSAPIGITSAQVTPISTTASADGALTWNEFFRLRKVRRYYSLVSSLGLSVTSLGIGMAILSQQNLNTLGQTMFGLDPMVVIGIWSVGFFGLGWLMGPAVGAGIWGLAYRSRVKTMAAVSHVLVLLITVLCYNRVNMTID